MNNCCAFLVAFLLLVCPVRLHAGPGAKTLFQANLESLVAVAGSDMGMESLKGVEVARGEWTCKQDLDGFVTTVREKEYDPRGVLYVYAASVRPVAAKYANMLAVNGLHGFKCRDSDTDKTVEMDRTTQSRKLIFSRRERYATIIVTVTFAAHGDNSTVLTVEAR